AGDAHVGDGDEAQPLVLDHLGQSLRHQLLDALGDAAGAGLVCHGSSWGRRWVEDVSGGSSVARARPSYGPAGPPLTRGAWDTLVGMTWAARGARAGALSALAVGWGLLAHLGADG